MSRECTACKLTKDVGEFYPNRPWCKRCDNLKRMTLYRRIRAEIIELLGGVCACCSEGQLVYLQIDHVHGGGSAARKVSRSIHELRRKVEETPSNYQVLCANCHAAKTVGVTCPHQTKDRDDEPSP